MSMPWLELAWRNLLRHRWRSVLTVAVVAIGVAALVFAWGLFDGANDQSVRAMTDGFTGQVQIRRPGYGADPSLDLHFEAARLPLDAVEARPGVRAAAPRLQAPVMVSTDAATRGVLLVGIDPAREAAVTSLHQRLVQGRWLDGAESGGIVLGRALAQALGTPVGGQVAVLTQGLQGSIGAARYTVAGIYDSGNEMVDGLQVFISLADAQALLAAPGRLTAVALRLGHYRDSAQVASGLQAGLGAGFEVEGWTGLLPDLAQKVAFHEWIGRIVMVMLFGIVMVGVANTLMMSTLERRREHGVMLALGTRPAQLFGVIVLEAALIGLLGFTIGLALGGAAVAWFGSVGLGFAEQAQALQQMPGVSTRLHPQLSVERMLFIGAAVLLLALLAGLLPAWRTARLDPMQALRSGAQQRHRAPGGAPAAARFLVVALALRNLGRHPLRTMGGGFGLMFATASFVFLACFINGYAAQVVENAIGFIAGDGQVQHREYRARLDPALALADGEGLLRTLADMPDVQAAALRVQAPGLVASPQGAEPVQLVGVQPDRERGVSFLHKAVRIGRYLDPARDHEVVLGRTLARRLKVQTGDKVVVTAQDVHGALAAEAFVVVGLFDTGSHGFDETLAQLSMPALQRLLGLGGRSTSVVFRARPGSPVPALLAGLRQHLQAQGDDPAARVYAWQELLPEVAQMTALLRGSLWLVMALVFGTMALVLLNMVLMSVLERTREFGILLAIGTPPSLIVRVVLIEAAVLGSAGALAGLGLGTLAAWVHSQTGMSMRSHGLSSLPGTTDVVYPQLSFGATLLPALAMVALVVLVSAWPAWRAARLQPVAALRTG